MLEIAAAIHLHVCRWKMRLCISQLLTMVSIDDHGLLLLVRVTVCIMSRTFNST